jgi:hypothetical protein
MTNQEAKFILSAYRAGGQDANDPVFKEALRHAQQDPALAAWFAREQAHSAAMAAKVGEVTPPAGLRAAILAGARVSEAPRLVRWHQASWLAAAAGFAVLLTATTLVVLRPTSASAAPKLAAFAVDDTLHAQHGGHGAPASALGAMLAQPSTRLGRELPVDFATLRTTGCRTLQFGGHDVIEVCFSRGHDEFHLYVVQRADFPGLPAKKAPGVVEKNGAAALAWSDANHYYVVVSSAGRDPLQALL